MINEPYGYCKTRLSEFISLIVLLMSSTLCFIHSFAFLMRVYQLFTINNCLHSVTERNRHKNWHPTDSNFILTTFIDEPNEFYEKVGIFSKSDIYQNFEKKNYLLNNRNRSIYSILVLRICQLNINGLLESILQYYPLEDATRRYLIGLNAVETVSDLFVCSVQSWTNLLYLID